MKKVFIYSLIASFVFLFERCKSDNQNAKKVNIDYKSYDFYIDLQKLDLKNISGATENLYKKYPNFFTFYTDTIMGIGNINTNKELLDNNFINLFSNKDYRWLSDTLVEIFPNTKSIDKELNPLFQQIKYYFGDWIVPPVYYFQSTLRLYSALSYSGGIAVGLDMYMGKNFRFYPSVAVPDYMLKDREPTQIPIDVAKVIFNDFYYIDIEKENLLDLMIDYGKQIYFVEKMLPEKAKNLFFNCTSTQYNWLKDNEGEMWSYFVKYELLYKNDLKDKMKFVSDAPTTIGMPPESPGKAGVFIGYKIVDNYMKNTKSTLPQLLKERDAQKILTEAKYKPQ